MALAYVALEVVDPLMGGLHVYREAASPGVGVVAELAGIKVPLSLFMTCSRNALKMIDITKYTFCT